MTPDVFRKRGKRKNCRFCGVTCFKTWFFYCSFFSKCRHVFFNFFHSFSDTFYFLIRKSDASWNCLCKNKLFKQDRSNRSIFLSNVIQNKIFRKQTSSEFRHKTLMHWNFFLIHALRKSKENAKKCRFLKVTCFMKWLFECKLFSTSDTFSRVWFEIWHVIYFC